MIPKKFRERAVRAMFPSVSYGSPLWKEFVIEGGEDVTAPAAARVARSMWELDKEIRAELEAELAELRRETASTLPPPPRFTSEHGAVDGDVIVKHGHRYAGARGKIQSFSTDGYLVLLEKCSMLPAGGLFTFKHDEVIPG